jgi:hypothetical protein
VNASIHTKGNKATIQIRDLTKAELRIGAMLYPERSYWKPTTRGECANAERPCPYVSCKHHLYLDVNRSTGSIKFNFPDLEPWEMKTSCVLDVAADGPHTLEHIGTIMNFTRERARQIESSGLKTCARRGVHLAPGA